MRTKPDKSLKDSKGKKNYYEEPSNKDTMTYTFGNFHILGKITDHFKVIERSRKGHICTQRRKEVASIVSPCIHDYH